MDAGDRNAWTADQDERPLTELGWRQAEALAGALGSLPIAAVYAGTALRCRQSVEKLAERLGLTVAVMPELGEKRAWRAPDGWDGGTWDAAFAAGMIATAVDKLRTLYPEGHVVACSHGHTIPAYVAHQSAIRGVEMPQLKYRGQWYRARFVESRADIELIEVQGFPR
jgi:8-oxo-dGTP diphosphatase